MKLALTADIHLNCLFKESIIALAKEIGENSDVIAIAGDIAEAPSLHELLTKFGEHAKKPVYYIHGNHDFCKASFSYTKSNSEEYTLQKYVAKRPNPKWLQILGIVELTKDTALIGHDGFYDARYGDFFNSDFIIGDLWQIPDIMHLSQDQRYSLFNRLGDQCADYAKEQISKAAQTYKNIIFITHIPPFDKVCLYNGKPSSSSSLPYFSNKALGDALLDLKDEFPNVNITVFSGHTHHGAKLDIDNLHVIVSDSEYYKPDYKVIDI